MKPKPPIYCTGGCDVCRDYARELGVPLVVPSPPLRRYRNVGGAAMVPDPEGQWVHVRDLGEAGWRLDPTIPTRRDQS